MRTIDQSYSRYTHPETAFVNLPRLTISSCTFQSSVDSRQNRSAITITLRTFAAATPNPTKLLPTMMSSSEGICQLNIYLGVMPRTEGWRDG